MERSRLTSHSVSQDEFLSWVRSRAARIATGGSAMRGKGNSGASAAARSVLRSMDLSILAYADEAAFGKQLDMQTSRVLAGLPRGARHWGLARKVVNIFLRDCLYTSYLRDVFKLGPLESMLEVPLDSYVAKRLIETQPGQLPRWRGVKHVSPSESHLLQAAAVLESQRLGVARVHLDAYYWSAARD